MKLNKISMMLAAVALVGCSDDLGERFTDQALEDTRLIQLGDNFALGGVGDEGATTRSHWEQIGTTSAFQNVFMPILNASGSANQALTDVGVTADEVGLCWLGQGAPTSDVYTNYQFTHTGWLYTGQKEPEIFCDKLENGILYSETQLKGVGTVGEEPALTNLQGQSSPIDKSAAVFNVNPLNPTDYDVNLNSGVYKTENKSIFGGDYIVYYPFNENFKEAGTIPAIAVTKFENAPTNIGASALAKATFRYSDPVTIQGGDQAAGFKMHNLSTLVQLQVSTVDGDAISSSDMIDQIVLYSAKEQLLAKANLAANLIALGNSGTDLYADTEGIKTIVANFTTALTGISTTPIKAYITVLPTTVEDLVVLVHNSTQKKWAKVNIGAKTFKTGGATGLKLTVANSDFKAEYIAVDDASLATAITEIASAEATIEVIGDITVSNKTIPAKVTVQGDKLIVPEGVTLTVKGTVKSDIDVLGKSCCSSATKGGALVVEGGLISNVTMVETEAKATTDALYDQYNPTLTYSAAATVAAGSKVDVQAGNVVVHAIVSHKADFVVAEDAKVVVNATGGLNFMGATVENNGTIEVMKHGKFDMTDADGNATASDGENMTNNGKFIHNVDAAVGTAVQAMKMGENGEYRCRVDKQEKLTDAYHQWTACSVIEMVNTTAVSYNLGTAAKIATNPTAKTAPYKHNNKFIDIEVKSTSASILTTFDNAADGNEDIQIGNLTSNTKLVINFNGSSKKRTLTVNGDMTVNANTDLKSSNKINVKGNLAVNNSATLYYRAADGGLAVTYDITVDGGMFDAAPKDVLNITCANFYLKNAATAVFGNRTSGETKTMTVTGTISNPAGCTFKQIAATDPNLLAWITCTTLKVGGEFPGGQPKVVN